MSFKTIATVLICFHSITNAIISPIVKTTNGPVQGMVKSYHNEDIIQFKRIPFAEPPIGTLRFQKPIPHASWTRVLNTTSFGPSCYQHLLHNDEWLLENKIISEDCLHLNIYVPRNIDTKVLKCVMVWIHGGGFTAGQGTLFDASYLALEGDVIVVTINYRLGLFGFLSTEDDNAPGNYGIWDQKLAIEWVYHNIANFGGDKNRITIFGESAGGYSVGLHTIIPSNKGYFHRAISQSGVVYSPRALASDSRRVAIETGRLLNCTRNTMVELLQCLKSKGANDILNVQNEAVSGWDDTENFISRLGPVIDGDLITDDPENILRDANSNAYEFFQTLDIMAGTNNAEGGLMYWRMMKYQEPYNFNISEGIPKEALCGVITPAVHRSYFNNSNFETEITEAICRQYTVKHESLAEQGRSAVNVYADLQFVVPTVKTLRAHANSNSISQTFQYIFTHQPSFPWIQERPSWLKGANHAGELPFVFGLKAMYPPTSVKSSSEMDLSKKIMIYWSNFAKSGNPNIGSAKNNDEKLPQWPNFDTNALIYMNLSEKPHSGSKLYEDRVKFWTYTLPEMLRDVIVTTTHSSINSALSIHCSVYIITIICLVQLGNMLRFISEI